MPPSTHRRPRTRRAGSTPDNELPDSSPSRPRTKRRKVQDIQEPAVLSVQDQINAVTASLAMPDPNPMVASQHANHENYRQNTQGITAYAKLAGATWTYYVKELLIRIGRPPDARPSTAGSPTPPPQLKTDDVVHIDLGPSKLVSRSHAIISYDMDGEHNWQLHVLGRNGVKVDDEQYKKDSKIDLRSGSILEIGGVQMMFVLPDGKPIVVQSILRRLRVNMYGNAEDDLQLHPTQSNESSNYDTSVMPSSQNVRASSSQQLAPSLMPAEAPSQAEILPKTKNTPSYHRGLVLESTEDVDYADDSMKDLKPPWSYALLIAQAILSSEGEQLTLSSIYQLLMDKYAFYRHSNTGWQNSIRHNLSLNKAFRKIPRRTDEPGKGMKWEIVPEHRDDFIAKLQKPAKAGRQASSPGSPSPRATKGQPHLQPVGNRKLSQSHGIQGSRLEDSQDVQSLRHPIIKRSPRSITPPPIPSYRVAPLEGYTPDRSSRMSASRNQESKLSDVSSNLHHTRRASTIANDMLSSSSQQQQQQQQHNITSSMHVESSSQVPPSPSQASPYADDNAAATAVTPAPQRQHPRLAPPSTGQLPSSYLPTSSPAPFWKYVQFGSTPAKQGDFSPLKDLHSSSPPPVGGPDGSSSRIRELGSPLKERGGGSGGGGFHLAGVRESSGQSIIPDGKDDDDEDGMGDLHGVDLARGFEKIGKFHMNGRIADSWAD